MYQQHKKHLENHQIVHWKNNLYNIRGSIGNDDRWKQWSDIL